MPPAPKNPALLQRRNKATTRAVLPAESETATRAVPELPARDDKTPWRPEAIAWWTALWRSPMAVEYVDLDRHEMLVGACLVHDYWSATTPSARTALAAEIRHQGRRFGRDPMARRGMQWEIKRPGSVVVPDEEEKPKRKQRKPRRPAKDPRKVLKLA